MALLAQLPHNPPAIDLGHEDWVLHLFQCNGPNPGICATWDYRSGANAAFVIPKTELGSRLVNPPEKTDLIGELWIAGWHRHEDAVPAEKEADYYDRDSFDGLPDELQYPKGFDSDWRTKTGGMPYWTGNGLHGLDLPSRPFEYLMQIDTLLFVDGSVPDPSVAGCCVTTNYANGKQETQLPATRLPNAPWDIQHDEGMTNRFYCTIANFGSDGTAYVFLNRQTNPPEAIWFWNR